jgi:hypothetical protein
MASQEWHWEQGTKYAAEAIKTTLLLNGAAAIALMTFATTHTQKVSLLVIPLISFVLGAALSTLAFFDAYMAQLNFGNAEGIDRQARGDAEYLRLWKVGLRWTRGSIGSLWLSVVAFGFGIFWSARVLLQLAANTTSG